MKLIRSRFMTLTKYQRFKGLAVGGWACVLLMFGSLSQAFTLPENFSDSAVIQNLQDPDGFAFAPDGRLFISERITGKLRVAKYNQNNDSWSLNATPFYTFDIPKDASNQPEPRRSGGLRDIAFDPDFANNGFVYAFYMKDDVLHNRVVRIKASASNPDVADSGFGEQLLIDLPFNDSMSSGSHNGGAVEFGSDNMLYITTGDGWEGAFQGDPVQSLQSFTGKVLRINVSGIGNDDIEIDDNNLIPGTNPFRIQTSDTYRAIYALGLRNPYSMSRHPNTGVLYINEARGSNKAEIYIVESAANYRHEGTGIGNSRTPWANAAGAGGELITGGAWLNENGLGNFPATYYGRYFAALWGGNSTNTGRINTIASDSDPSSEVFETGIGVIGANSIPVKPVVTRFNAQGDLYYMLTTYTTSSGQIRRVRFTSQQTVASPTFSELPGNYADPISVTLDSATADATIRCTVNNSEVTAMSPQCSTPIAVDQSIILRARAFKTGFNDSSESSAVYIIGDTTNNVPPTVSAGADKQVFVGQNTVLDGSATTDPDGDDDFLTGEQWTQLAGPVIEIQDATEEIAFFTPPAEGVYRFHLQVSDGIDTASDEVVITAIRAPRVLLGLQALYTFEEGSGTQIDDVSGVAPALDLTIATPSAVGWNSPSGLDVTGSTLITSAVATKLINACSSSNEISIEAWVTPANITQDGPARIASLSGSIFDRNFTLGQVDDRYDVRLRTSATNDNGTPSLTVPASTAKTQLSHILYTRDAQGDAAIYIDGIPQVVGTVGGEINNWNSSYMLSLANEVSGDRPWLGKLSLVAIYCKALSSNEIAQNFSAGLPPFEPAQDTDEDDVPDLVDNCPDDANADQANFDGDSQGDACDDDKDNDGVSNSVDDDELNNKVCTDSDADLCDDCAIGADGLGPLNDALPNNDGPDNDSDGQCDTGDPNDDNDGFPDVADNCPFVASDNQADSDGNGVGDVCDTNNELCVAVAAKNGKIFTICL